MIKLQQYSFVCAPQPAQWAAAVAMDADISSHVAAYRKKRDLLVDGISDLYEVAKPGGAFLRLPKGSLGDQLGVRDRSNREQLAHHSRQHLQPPRHSLPYLVRRRRLDDRARGSRCFVGLPRRDDRRPASLRRTVGVSPPVAPPAGLHRPFAVLWTSGSAPWLMNNPPQLASTSVVGRCPARTFLGASDLMAGVDRFLLIAEQHQILGSTFVDA